MVKFSQVLNLRSGSFSLCLGCTQYVGDDLVVFHRLYDILLLRVVSQKGGVGFFDPGSDIDISVFA